MEAPTPQFNRLTTAERVRSGYSWNYRIGDALIYAGSAALWALLLLLAWSFVNQFVQ